jgi:radical SAM-linked protein
MKPSSLKPSFSPGVSLQRVRVRLARRAAARFYSHLKQLEEIKKALLKSGWPLITSGAHKLRPKVAFGPAISVGYESEAEYFDVELGSRLDALKGQESLGAVLPEGYEVMSVKSVPRFFPSLDQTLNAAKFILTSPDLRGTDAAWQSFAAVKEFPVVKKKQDREEIIDARQCVRSWSLNGDTLDLEIRFGPGRTLKPERIVQAVCQFNDEQADASRPESVLRVKRTQLFMEKTTGELSEP